MIRVAGIGFRHAATLTSLYDALVRAGQCDAIATSQLKANARIIQDLAQQLGLPLLGVDVRHVATPTRSPHVLRLYHTGSVSEAAALGALAPGGRIVVGRMTSSDHMATAAIAQGDLL